MYLFDYKELKRLNHLYSMKSLARYFLLADTKDYKHYRGNVLEIHNHLSIKRPRLHFVVNHTYLFALFHKNTKEGDLFEYLYLASRRNLLAYYTEGVTSVLKRDIERQVNENNPLIDTKHEKVIILKGRVIKFRIGLIKKLIKPRIKPAISKVFIGPVKTTPATSSVASQVPKIPAIICKINVLNLTVIRK